MKGTKKIPAKPLTVDFSLFLLAEGVRGKEREKTVLYVVLLSCVWSDCCCVLLGAPFTWIPAPKLARALLKSSQSLASTRRCSGDRSGRPAVHNIPSGVYVLSLCVFILHTPRITRFSFFLFLKTLLPPHLSPAPGRERGKSTNQQPSFLLVPFFSLSLSLLLYFFQRNGRMDGWNENARTRIESVLCLWYRTREVEHDDHSLELELWRVWISAPPTLFAPGGSCVCLCRFISHFIFIFLAERENWRWVLGPSSHTGSKVRCYS